MSVHGRLIARGDDGEYKPLVDKKDGGRMNRPTGENMGGYDRRGRGRGGRGGYDDRHGDRNRGGRGGGRGGFNTGERINEPVYDEQWRKEQDELQSKMNAQAAANMEQARAQKNDG